MLIRAFVLFSLVALTIVAASSQVLTASSAPAVTQPIPFQTQLSLQGFAPNGVPTASSASFTVPAGQRLHIQYVTVAATSPFSTSFSIIAGQATINTSVGGAAVTYTLTGGPVGLSGLVSLYADAGTVVTISAAVSSAALVGVSGELI
jgi:hypothetical protein